MRIYYAIEYADEKEVESLIGYAITDVNWSNDVLLGVSVIYTLIVQISCFMIFNYNI